MRGKLIGISLAMAAVLTSQAVSAETRPEASAYGAPSGAIQGISRVGMSTGKMSKLDDTSTFILVAAAGVFGYFLYDITHSNSRRRFVSPGG